MDNGEEIPGLNEDWQFAGAKLFEWMAGFIMLMVAAETLVEHAGRSMPLLVSIMVATTFGMAAIRRSFPDEERGVRNLVMLSCGFSPPGIPRPAKIQPLWSGSPMREIGEDTIFMQLKLDEIFPSKDPEEEDEVEKLYGKER